MRAKLTALGMLLLLGRATYGQRPAADRFEKVIVSFIEAFNAADYVAIQRDFSQEMRAALPLEKSTAFFNSLLAQQGKILKPDAPRRLSADQAVFTTQFERGVLDIKVVLNDRDQIAGLLILPHIPALPVPDKNETKLSLPFTVRWFVVWGGDTKELNHHHDTLNQRYAFDFVGVGEGIKRVATGLVGSENSPA